METIPEIGAPRFEPIASLPLDVDDADLLEVLLTDDIDNSLVNLTPEKYSEETKLDDLELMSLPPSVSMPIKEETAMLKDSVKFEEEVDEQTIKDPNELKKQRRLIRNRMSAQLHRERKKAYIDKLEAEVKQRDVTIGGLNARVYELESENSRLLQLLSQCASCNRKCKVQDEPFDIGFTTHEESCESDASDDSGTLSSLGKRFAPTSSASPTTKAARFAPGTLLASLACLFLFRSSFVDMNSGVASPTLQGDSPARLGRVLFSVGEEDQIGESLMEDEAVETQEPSFKSDSSFALVASPNQGRLNPPPSIPVKPIPITSAPSINNKSYFFCPSTFQSSSGAWPQALNDTEFSALSPRHGQYKRRLRANAKKQDPHRSAANSPPITLSSQPPQQEESGSLVVRNRATNSLLGGQSGSYDDAEDQSFPQLTLIVPSSSLEGMVGLDAQSNWLEIDCRMQSARFIDLKQ